MFTFQCMASESSLLQKWHTTYWTSASGIVCKTLLTYDFMTFRIKCPFQQHIRCWVVTSDCMWSLYIYICLSSHVARPRPGHKYHFISIIKLIMYGTRCFGVEFYTPPQSRARINQWNSQLLSSAFAANDIRVKPLYSQSLHNYVCVEVLHIATLLCHAIFVAL